MADLLRKEISKAGKSDKYNSVIRLVTSWATKESMVLNFINDLKKIY